MGGPSNERRRNLERRQRERRARIADLQANHDDLRAIIERNAEQIKRLEAEQQVQLIRIAQIQREIDALKKSR
jgi:hypothetical protein